MIKAFSGYDEVVVEWVAARMKMDSNDLKPCTTIAFLDDEKLVCGVVFNNFRRTSRDISLTIAADTPRWISRTSLGSIFGYVFEQLGCIRLTVCISRKNKRARKLAEGVGFKYEGNVRRGYDGLEDAIMYGMLSQECRWIGDRNGKKYTCCP